MRLMLGCGRSKTKDTRLDLRRTACIIRQEEELGRLVDPLDLPGVLCAVNRPLYITSALQHMIVHDIKYQVFLTPHSSHTFSHVTLAQCLEVSACAA